MIDRQFISVLICVNLWFLSCKGRIVTTDAHRYTQIILEGAFDQNEIYISPVSGIKISIINYI